MRLFTLLLILQCVARPAMAVDLHEHTQQTVTQTETLADDVDTDDAELPPARTVTPLPRERSTQGTPSLRDRDLPPPTPPPKTRV